MKPELNPDTIAAELRQMHLDSHLQVVGTTLAEACEELAVVRVYLTSCVRYVFDDGSEIVLGR